MHETTGAVPTSPLFTFRGSTTTATTPRTPSSEPTVNLLNAINLNLEKVVRRQIEFEHTVIRKLDTSNKRVSGVELSLNTILERLDEVKATREGPSTTEAVLTDEMFSDVPSNYRLTFDELEYLRTHSSGVGNFALALTRKLFPELGGPGNLR